MSVTETHADMNDTPNPLHAGKGTEWARIGIDIPVGAYNIFILDWFLNAGTL